MSKSRRLCLPEDPRSTWGSDADSERILLAETQLQAPISLLGMLAVLDTTEVYGPENDVVTAEQFINLVRKSA